jgi:hypothetical protein
MKRSIGFIFPMSLFPIARLAQCLEILDNVQAASRQRQNVVEHKNISPAGADECIGPQGISACVRRRDFNGSSVTAYAPIAVAMKDVATNRCMAWNVEFQTPTRLDNWPMISPMVRPER